MFSSELRLGQLAAKRLVLDCALQMAQVTICGCELLIRKSTDNNRRRIFRVTQKYGSGAPDRYQKSAFCFMNIIAAFQRAAVGKKCPVCQNRFSHAIFQRHYEACEAEKAISEPGTSVQAVNVTLNHVNFSPAKAPSSCSNSNHGSVRSKRSSTRLSLLAEGDEPSTSEGVSRTIYEKRVRRTLHFSETIVDTNQQPLIDINDDFPEPETALGNHAEGTSQENLGLMQRTELESANQIIRMTPTSFIDNNVATESTNECKAQFPDTIHEGYCMAIDQLRKLNREQGWNSFRATQSASQAIDRLEDDDMASENIMLSEQSSSQFGECFALHYSLKFFWHIALRVLRGNMYDNTETYENDQDNSNTRLVSEFWGETNLRYLHSLVHCSTDAQQLFVRLLLRRREWYSTQNSITTKQLPGASPESIALLLEELKRANLLESNSSCLEKITLDKELHLLQTTELVKLCKEFKVFDKTSSRSIYIEKLKNAASQRCVYESKVEEVMLKRIRTLMGICYRLREDVANYFLALITLYSPTSMDTSVLMDRPDLQSVLQDLMFNLLQFKTNKHSYPAPVTTAHIIYDLYTTYDDLAKYVKAKALEQTMIRLTVKKNHDSVLKLGDEAKKQLLETIDYNSQNIYANIPVYLRKFTAAWVLARCCFHYVEAAQKLKQFDLAVEILNFLTTNEGVRLLCSNYRGKWYQRLVTNLDYHLKDKEKALEACVHGLQDQEVGPPMALWLQRRAEKMFSENNIEESIRIAEPCEPNQITISGNIFAKNFSSDRLNNFYIGDSMDRQSVTVEKVALEHFLNGRFNEGVHAEGAVWHTIFGLICYDVIFASDIPNTWLSEIQSNPVDLNYKDFYLRRQDAFENTFSKILSDRKWLNKRVKENYTRYYGCVNSEIDWNCFHDVDQILRFISCCKSTFLEALFRRMATDYYNTRSGFPDLTVWNANKKELAVCEVKGPGDTLSMKQCLWLDFFMKRGVEAYLCNVEAKKDRLLTQSQK
ncbi:VRR-NUC domain-containing protein [Ditylenchus destructor]|uniref:Fanconi-associated nuclease n=1 Tax=Ditylenchus destructor TaxID=166010 RepID=A0AAD4N8I1_9BILA|nr:VRR-NUC domain-containing protein [Ditylenchus destructor]